MNKNFYSFFIFNCLLYLVLLANCTNHSSNNIPTITIAAAAHLEKVLNEIGKDFEAESNIKPIFSFGATSNLAKQIENNAPFDMFISADVKTVDLLIEKNLLIPTSKRIYAQGKLVVWWPQNAKSFPTSLKDLANPEFKRIAIANPEIAPYGKAAKEALQNSDLWSEVEKKIVYGENVAMAYQYAKTANTDLAIIARSLVDPQDKYLLVAENLYQPLDQALATVGKSQNIVLVEKFDTFLVSSKAKALFEKYGYKMP